MVDYYKNLIINNPRLRNLLRELLRLGYTEDKATNAIAYNFLR